MNSELPGYELYEVIGSGAFGKVYRATKLYTHESCAVKVLSLSKMSSKALAYLDREIQILRSLSHRNIARLLEVVSTSSHKYLIFEYYNGGDLSTFLKSKGGRLDEDLVRCVIRQVIKAMDCLNNLSLIHRDIKLSNIFLHFAESKSEPVVKLGDFGFAREITVGDLLATPETALDMSYAGTPLNMAPEIAGRQPYSFEADIWSLGTVTYELLCGNPCFYGRTHYELEESIEAGVYKIPKFLNLSYNCMDFISKCLVQDPNHRIKWEQVLSHPFIRKDTQSAVLLPDNKWPGCDGKFYTFSTKNQEENPQLKKAKSAEYSVVFSEAENGFVLVDAAEEMVNENGFVVL